MNRQQTPSEVVAFLRVVARPPEVISWGSRSRSGDDGFWTLFEQTPGPVVVLVDWTRDDHNPGYWGYGCFGDHNKPPTWWPGLCSASRVITREGCAVFRQVCLLDWGHPGEHVVDA